MKKDLETKRIYTKEEIRNLIIDFESSWQDDRYVFDKDYESETVASEFYHGACHFFSTALAVVLGHENCHIYNLYGLHTDGSKELIHSIVDYIPVRKCKTGFNRALRYHYIDDSAYDIQSGNGMAWEQAEYVFIDDGDCRSPFHPQKWDDRYVWWEIEPVNKIKEMLESYENGNASEKEIEYWLAIYNRMISILY